MNLKIKYVGLLLLISIIAIVSVDMVDIYLDKEIWPLFFGGLLFLYLQKKYDEEKQ